MVFNVSKHYDVVLIGKQGENLARTIQFDFSPWQADYGDGTVSILNKRNTDSSPYPVTLTTEGTIATWKPTSSDTQYAGAGFLEVVYTVNGIIAKSATFNTYTTPALGQSTTPPAPYQAWVDEVLEAKDDAVEAAEDAEEAKEAIEDMSATASVDSSVGTPSVTVTKTTISGHENLDFAFHNLKGDVGTLPIASSTGVDSAKINDKTNNVASGDGALAVNGETKATGDAATAMGWQSEAHGDASNARGYKTKATGVGAESSGISSVATGNYSEAHGRATVASGEASASFGFGTKASQPNQFVVGKYNAENSDDVVIVGGGTANNARKNIVSVETDGDVRVKGKMYFDANDDGTGGTEVKAYASGKGIKIDNNAIKARIGNGLRFMPNLEQGNEGYDIAADYTKVQSAITNDNKLDYSLIANTPTIPTKTSDLDNDSGFITSSYHDTTKQDVLSAGTGIDITGNTASTNVPTITIALSQVTSQNPLTIELTSEQKTLIEKESQALYLFDLTSIGNAKSYVKKVSQTNSIILLTDEYFSSLLGKGGAWKFSYDVDSGLVTGTQFIFANSSDVPTHSGQILYVDGGADTVKTKLDGIALDVSDLSDVTTLHTSQIAAKYTKPASGIPASDIASGVIPSVSASGTGTSTTEANFLTINGTEWKLAGEEYSAGTNITINNNVISANVGGDVIQDPDDQSGGKVTASALADVDDTLSIQGDAADAKATGDAIATKEAKGKVTISGTERTVTTHSLSITEGGVTTTYTLLGV